VSLDKFFTFSRRFAVFFNIMTEFEETIVTRSLRFRTSAASARRWVTR